jgi:hypothetical protein
MLDVLGADMTEYDDDVKSDNYRVLENGIKFYVENRPITEDFLEESIDLIITYNANLPNLSKANPLIRDYKFRELMVESESLLHHLQNERRETGKLNIKLFHDFCKKQKQCLEIVKKIDGGMDDLTNMMSSLGLKTNIRKLKR